MEQRTTSASVRRYPHQVRVWDLCFTVALSAIVLAWSSGAFVPPLRRDHSWPSRCPACGSKDLAELLYGLIRPDERLHFSALGLYRPNTQMRRAIADGIFQLRGCVIGNSSPEWQCNSCKHQWGNALRKLGEAS